MSRVKQALKKAVLIWYRLMTRILPVKKRVIVFQSNLGRNYTGSPRAIYEKMVEQGLDKAYRCYYILNTPSAYQGKISGKIKLLKNSRLAYYCVMAIAGIWISDTRFQNYIIKRKETLYIQTWHGTPLKKLALDLESLHMAGGETLEEYHAAFRQNTATWDILLSQNPFSTQTFQRAFAFTGQMLPIGYPRNDKLFHHLSREEIRQRKAAFGFPPDKRVMLYAPTWRDNAYYTPDSYRFETQMDFAKMEQAFGKDYVLAAKFHYMVKEKTDWNKHPGFVYPIDAETDIADLYPLADLLITDYSSVMFDYSLLKRPMFFYAYDLAAYRDTLRGFYFDFTKEAPGPIVTTTEELIQEIQSLLLSGEEAALPLSSGETTPQELRCQERYKAAYEAFCRKYNPYDDGHASEKLIEIIKKHTKASGN